MLLSGLLCLLRDLVLVQLPDQQAARLLSSALRPELLVVLARSPHPEVRASALQLFSALLTRANRSLLTRLLSAHIFPLLANQLHQHASTPALLDSAQALLVRPPPELHELDPTRRSQLCLLLGLLEGAGEIPSAAAAALRRLFEWLSVSQRWSEALEVGLVEVLLNCLHRAAAADPSEGGTRLQEALCEAFRLLAEFMLFSDGPLYGQQFEDVVRVLTMMEKEQAVLRGAQVVSGVAVNLLTSISAQLLARCGYNSLETLGPGSEAMTAARNNLRRQLAGARPAGNEEGRERLKAFFSVVADAAMFLDRLDYPDASKHFDRICLIFFLFVTRVLVSKFSLISLFLLSLSLSLSLYLSISLSLSLSLSLFFSFFLLSSLKLFIFYSLFMFRCIFRLSSSVIYS